MPNLSPEHQALTLFTRFMDGIITEAELVSGLAELPPEIVECLPEPGPSSPARPSFRSQVLELQQAIADGTAIRIRGGC